MFQASTSRMIDSFQTDARALLTALGRQVADWDAAISAASSEREVVVRLCPVTGPGTSPVAGRNAFEQVLRGLLAFNDSKGAEVNLYRVSVIDVERRPRDGNVATHSFLLTGLPSRMYRAMLSIDGYQSFAFVRLATSGYSGHGPALYKSLNELLDSAGAAVLRTNYSAEVDPLRRLFLAFGPSPTIRWPSAIFPPFSDDWAGRGSEPMADRYSDDELE